MIPPPEPTDPRSSGNGEDDARGPAGGKSGKVDVVAAVIRDRAGRLLIGQRPPHKRHGELWEFPGGKVDPGETLAQAVVRELREELGLAATWISEAPVFTRADRGHPYRIVFLEVEARGEPVLEEHLAIAWVPIPVPPSYRLAPSDHAFVEALARGEVVLKERD